MLVTFIPQQCGSLLHHQPELLVPAWLSHQPTTHQGATATYQNIRWWGQIIIVLLYCYNTIPVIITRRTTLSQRTRFTQTLTGEQPGPLSLVEVQQGLALIGRELHSVATPGLFCAIKNQSSLGGISFSSLVLYVA